MIKQEQYQCAVCKEVFDLQDDEEWSDEKAKAELKQTFGDVPIESCDIVCDDCYRKMVK